MIFGKVIVNFMIVAGSALAVVPEMYYEDGTDLSAELDNVENMTGEGAFVESFPETVGKVEVNSTESLSPKMGKLENNQTDFIESEAEELDNVDNMTESVAPKLNTLGNNQTVLIKGASEEFILPEMCLGMNKIDPSINVGVARFAPVITFAIFLSLLHTSIVYLAFA
ncbi:uncharacterized protein LOC116166000 isoform X2 [Photinus pyralis]|uniref:uncharacterized protein LOC116166000 isoform X2 n=1 Tax=Photinus pyralis TaxID=7054 RepID=UPI0012673D53|nr:uncharacterized protein LOC116166000 isoform X2 [Photinus pyralis]